MSRRDRVTLAIARAPGAGGGTVVALLVVASIGACRPTLDDRPWLVTAPRIVGVNIDPPEVLPGQSVSVQVVAIDPAGALDVGATLWSACGSGKPLGESRVVDDACVAVDPAAPDATGSPASLAIPAAACQVFGPDTPQPAPGAPATRPRDPDASGGYYQPLAVAVAGARAVALARVTCGLADASLSISRAFQVAYHANRNPTIAELTFQIGGAAIDPAAASIAPGARIAIQLAWTPGDAEAFPVFDRDTRALVAARERLDVSFYVTGGALDVAAAHIDDPDADATATTTATTWTAPDAAGTVELVAVLRDSRGGSDARHVTLSVE